MYPPFKYETHAYPSQHYEQNHCFRLPSGTTSPSFYYSIMFSIGFAFCSRGTSAVIDVKNIWNKTWILCGNIEKWSRHVWDMQRFFLFCISTVVVQILNNFLYLFTQQYYVRINYHWFVSLLFTWCIIIMHNLCNYVWLPLWCRLSSII